MFNNHLSEFPLYSATKSCVSLIRMHERSLALDLRGNSAVNYMVLISLANTELCSNAGANLSLPEDLILCHKGDHGRAYAAIAILMTINSFGSTTTYIGLSLLNKILACGSPI